MESKKIIIIFIGLVLSSSIFYVYYQHKQKVTLAEYYYNTGQFQKAYELNVGEISKKAKELMRLEEDLKNYLNTIRN